MGSGARPQPPPELGPIWELVRARIEARRNELHLSQENMANAIGYKGKEAQSAWYKKVKGTDDLWLWQVLAAAKEMGAPPGWPLLDVAHAAERAGRPLPEPEGAADRLRAAEEEIIALRAQLADARAQAAQLLLLAGKLEERIPQPNPGKASPAAQTEKRKSRGP